MRKNTQAVLKAWLTKEAKGNRGDSISTDGNTIYSYNTAIVVRTPDHSKVIAELNRLGYPCTQKSFVDATINRTKYSSTTSGQQNSILAYFKANDMSFNEGYRIPIGTTTRGLYLAPLLQIG